MSTPSENWHDKCLERVNNQPIDNSNDSVIAIGTTVVRHRLDFEVAVQPLWLFVFSLPFRALRLSFALQRAAACSGCGASWTMPTDVAYGSTTGGSPGSCASAASRAQFYRVYHAPSHRYCLWCCRGGVCSAHSRSHAIFPQHLVGANT